MFYFYEDPCGFMIPFDGRFIFFEDGWFKHQLVIFVFLLRDLFPIAFSERFPPLFYRFNSYSWKPIQGQWIYVEVGSTAKKTWMFWRFLKISFHFDSRKIDADATAVQVDTVKSNKFILTDGIFPWTMIQFVYVYVISIAMLGFTSKS